MNEHLSMPEDAILSPDDFRKNVESVIENVVLIS
jgi:hypothetical protein